MIRTVVSGEATKSSAVRAKAMERLEEVTAAVNAELGTEQYNTQTWLRELRKTSRKAPSAAAINGRARFLREKLAQLRERPVTAALLMAAEVVHSAVGPFSR